MQLYLACCGYHTDLEVIDTAGNAAATNDIEAFDKVITGAIISF